MTALCRRFLFWMCWLVYFASYIGRLNYSSAMPAMIGGSVITASQGIYQYGLLFAYGAGQFLNGMLADRLHPGNMIFIGLFASGLLNLAMGFLSGFGMMALFWCAQRVYSGDDLASNYENLCKDDDRGKKGKVLRAYHLHHGSGNACLVSGVCGHDRGCRLAVCVFTLPPVCMCASALVFWQGFARVERIMGHGAAGTWGVVECGNVVEYEERAERGKVIEYEEGQNGGR